VLVLLPDAFGGHGGISVYNRDFLTALSSHIDCEEIVAIPRSMPNPPETIPANINYITTGLNSKFKYIVSVFKAIFTQSDFDLVVCGHINILPLAYFTGSILKAPIILEIYGIDAWQPSSSFIINTLVTRIDAFISISEITKKRFLKWSRLSYQKGYLLPNTIHMEKYGIGPKKSELQEYYGIKGKTVLLTMGRLVSEDRAKGFDEVLNVLQKLIKDYPDIIYLIVGKGDDLKRLEEKAFSLGVSDYVIFTGYIPEDEKADHFRLADVYVMPSRGEGFGFVFLEAMACGIPTIGSLVDGSREALRDGMLGELVNPDSTEGLESAIKRALLKERSIPQGLEYFSYGNFSKRLYRIVNQVMSLSGSKKSRKIKPRIA